MLEIALTCIQALFLHWFTLAQGIPSSAQISFHSLLSRQFTKLWYVNL